MVRLSLDSNMDGNFADQGTVSGNPYGTSDPVPQDERVSIRSLLQMIDEYQWTEQSSTLRRLDEENRILQRQVSCYQRSWHATMDLLQDTFEVVLLIRCALDDCVTKVNVAKREWLAFWGIYMETTEELNYPLPKWI